MSDAVQVPREALIKMIAAIEQHSCYSKDVIEQWKALPAAPQATAPRTFEKWDEAKGTFVLTAEATDPRAEIERLTRERDACERQYQERVAEIGVEMSRTAAAQAENEKLRAALSALLDLDQRCGWFSKQADDARSLLAALSPPPLSPEEP